MNLTARQCRSARGLLKWNVHDLAARTSVLHKRIDSFERGIVKLHKPENEEIIKVFIKEGVEFKENFEVELSDKKGKSEGGSVQASTGGNQNIGQTIVIDAQYYESTTAKSSKEDEKKQEHAALARRPQPK